MFAKTLAWVRHFWRGFPKVWLETRASDRYVALFKIICDLMRVEMDFLIIVKKKKKRIKQTSFVVPPGSVRLFYHSWRQTLNDSPSLFFVLRVREIRHLGVKSGFVGEEERLRRRKCWFVVLKELWLVSCAFKAELLSTYHHEQEQKTPEKNMNASIHHSQGCNCNLWNTEKGIEILIFTLSGRQNYSHSINYNTLNIGREQKEKRSCYVFRHLAIRDFFF